MTIFYLYVVSVLRAQNLFSVVLKVSHPLRPVLGFKIAVHVSIGEIRIAAAVLAYSKSLYFNQGISVLV